MYFFSEIQDSKKGTIAMYNMDNSHIILEDAK